MMMMMMMMMMMILMMIIVSDSKVVIIQIKTSTFYLYCFHNPKLVGIMSIITKIAIMVTGETLDAVAVTCLYCYNPNAPYELFIVKLLH